MNHIFQTSVLIMECIELNWLCKHIKKIRSSQPAIPVLNWVKHHSFLPVSILKEFLMFQERIWKAWSTKVLKHYCFIKLIAYFKSIKKSSLVWKRASGYCLCYCKAFSLVSDSTECTKTFVTKRCRALFVSPKIKLYYRSKENHQ